MRVGMFTLSPRLAMYAVVGNGFPLWDTRWIRPENDSARFDSNSGPESTAVRKYLREGGVAEIVDTNHSLD